MRVGCLVLVALMSCAPENVGRREEFELSSGKVGDTFKIFVRVPPSYDTDTSLHFPLVVQLDANLPFLDEYNVVTEAVAGLELSGAIEDVIVVGIGYPRAEDAERLRLRDFSLPMTSEPFRAQWGAQVPVQGGPQFYEFIRDELMPELTQRYRLNGPARTALFGHSMGGLFSTYAATRHAEAPLFSAYLAASPSLFWDDGQVITQFDSLPEFGSTAQFMITDGSLEGPEMSGFVQHFARNVEDRARVNLLFYKARYEAGHMGTTRPSFRDSLRLFFPGVTP